MNDLFVLLDIGALRPLITALLLPPVPLFVLLLLGTRLILPRRGLGWAIVMLSVALLWSSMCSGTARLLSQVLLRPPPALASEGVAQLKAQVQARKPVAIVVLGAGVEAFAAEYGTSTLSANSLERLRYGLWLARETGAPLAFSGGVGWGQADTMAEAQVAARVAAQEFGRPIKWLEDSSRDTRENARHTVAMLAPAGVEHLVIVTHAFHMPRALRHFETAARDRLTLEAAPIKRLPAVSGATLAWLPSAEGYTQVRAILRELLARAVGA